MGSPEFDRAAIDLGHEVRRVAWRELLGRRFVNGAPSELQRAIMKAVDDFNPDLVFAQTHQSEVVSTETYRALRDNGAFVVNWCGDVREPLPECYARIAAEVDVMAFSNMTDVELIRDMGHRSEYLQIGYDPEIYHPGDGNQERRGIVFMANNYEGRFPNTELRKAVALRLKKEFPHDFTLYGSGWGLPGVRPTVNGEEEADIYRSSLIAINVDHFTRPYFASDRILRAQACGCSVWTLPCDNGVCAEHPNLRRCTAEGAGMDEMITSMRGSLDAPAGMVKNALKAAEHLQQNHTWKNRIQTMGSWMS